MTFFQTPFCGRSGGRDLRVTIVHNVQCNITGVFWIFVSLFVETPHEIYHLTQSYIVRGGVVYFKKLHREERAQGKSL